MKRPWHLWVIPILAVLWNAGGAFDYLMTQTGNEAYLSMLTAEQRAYLAAFPTWVEASWALGVWGAMFGSLALLVRLRLAAPLFLVSLLGLAGNILYGQVLSDPSAYEIMGTAGTLFSVLICLSILFLWLYSRRMAERGYLR